jgi:hypothetical protein
MVCRKCECEEFIINDNKVMCKACGEFNGIFIGMDDKVTLGDLRNNDTVDDLFDAKILGYVNFIYEEEIAVKTDAGYFIVVNDAI